MIYQLKEVLSKKTKIPRTAAEFETKMKEIEADYKKISIASGSSPPQWRHYSKVKQIFHDRHDINKENAYISDSIDGDNQTKKSSQFNINRGKPRVSAQVQKVNETHEQILQTFQEIKGSFVEITDDHGQKITALQNTVDGINGKLDNVVSVLMSISQAFNNQTVQSSSQQ